MLSASRNRVEQNKDATFHAELDCIRKATKIRNNWRLHNCTLYSTLEPCIMCLGAIQNSRIKRIVFAAYDHRLGACGSFVDLLNDHKHPFHQVEMKGGVLQEESSILLKRFFQLRRRENMIDHEDIIDRGFEYSEIM